MNLTQVSSRQLSDERNNPLAGATVALPAAHAACQDGYVVARDGVPLSYHYWPPQEEVLPTAIVLVLHGVPLYGKYFGWLGAFLGSHNVGVYALDNRGHGYSGGPRGDVDAPREQLLADIQDTVAQVRAAHPGVPFYLMGESWGGFLAIWYTAERGQDLDGLILTGTSTRLGIGKRELFNLATQFTWHKLTMQAAARIRLPDRTLVTLVRDPLVQTEIQSDPLLVWTQTARFVSIQMYIASPTRALKFAERISVPTLILESQNDSLVEPTGSQEIYDHILIARKKLAFIAGGDHAIFAGQQRETAAKLLLQWLNDCGPNGLRK